MGNNFIPFEMTKPLVNIEKITAEMKNYLILKLLSEEAPSERPTNHTQVKGIFGGVKCD